MARPTVADQVKDAADLLKEKATGKSRPAFSTDRPRPTNVRLATIELDPSQPRKNIGDISDLVASISEHGLIQPLVVESVDSKGFRLIAGERRFHACKEAGLDVVPAIVRTVQDQQRLEIQLIENLHRKDLDPFEEASAYKRLIEEFNLTQEQVAKRVGKSRTRITETLSLNRIPDEVRKECLAPDIPIAKETLFLVARQDDTEKMHALLKAAHDGASKDIQRAKARKGEPRASTEKKPKQAFSTKHGATVIVQSNSTGLDRKQIVSALTDALDQARHL